MLTSPDRIIYYDFSITSPPSQRMYQFLDAAFVDLYTVKFVNFPGFAKNFQ